MKKGIKMKSEKQESIETFRLKKKLRFWRFVSFILVAIICLMIVSDLASADTFSVRNDGGDVKFSANSVTGKLNIEFQNGAYKEVWACNAHGYEEKGGILYYCKGKLLGKDMNGKRVTIQALSWETGYFNQTHFSMFGRDIPVRRLR